MGKVELRIAIDAELAEQAEAAGVTLDVAFEEGVRQALLKKSHGSDAAKASDWAEANAEAIEDHRRRIQSHGIFGEDLRTW
ncbi:MAG: hypothetical protein EON94_11105 [Caulobacteraceae bacterium]|nr:MAG: hypothetical protein EON94_11105 [Caulobacteraceae bacterium]